MGLMKSFLRVDKYTRNQNVNVNRNSSSNNVEVSGFTENLEAFGRIMTNDPQMASIFKKYIRNVLKEARKKLSQDAKSYLKNDPRKAARAVKYSVYRSLFGGNISILQKRAGTAGARWMWIREKKLQPGQRGGNRRLRDGELSRLDQYYGADRGFVLRFINGGTVSRMTRYGNRGSIRQTNWFGHTAPWHMEDAAGQVAQAINEYVKQQMNG